MFLAAPKWAMNITSNGTGDNVTRKDVIEVVESVLVSCTDGVEGYRHAAEDVHDEELRHFLAHRAADREEIASVIRSTLVALGRKPPRHGSLSGAIHRGLLDTVGAIERHPARSILRECQRGEQQTIVAFTAALRHPLPDDVRGVLEAQLSRVFQASAALNRVTRDLDDDEASAHEA